MKKTSRFAGLMLALALGVMALGATVAHAEEKSFWAVSGTSISGTLKPQVQVTELETLPATGVKEGILLTKTGLTTVEVHCTKMTFVDALLGLHGSATGKIHFDGCTTKLNKGATSAVCIPHSEGSKTDGLIETNELTGLIVLHKLESGQIDELLQLSPTAGGAFVTLVFGKIAGSECSIKKFEITGKAFLKAGSLTEGKTETKTKLFSEGPLTALLFGGNPAVIDGSAIAELIGAHAGLLWSGHAA